MLQLMEADVVFADPNDPDPGIAVLVKHGFDVEDLDRWADYYGDDDAWPDEWLRKVFIRARITIEIDDDRPDPQGDFLDWVLSIVEPFGGDPIEGGFADPRVARHYSIARNN